MITPKTHTFFFLHGWGGSSKSNDLYVNELSKLGYGTCSFNLLGHEENGRDKDEISRKEFLDHIISKYDENYGQKYKKVIVVGTSFGAYMATLLSEIREVETLILRAPANYPDENFDLPDFRFRGDEQKIIAWRSTALTKDETLSLKALSHFEGNTLIVGSEYDEIVPHQTVRNYLNASKNGEHDILKNVGHRLKNDTDKKLFFETFYSWLLHK